jgi:hypothetical protein
MEHHDQGQSTHIQNLGNHFFLVGHRQRARDTLCCIWLEPVTWSVFGCCSRWRWKMALG